MSKIVAMIPARLGSQRIPKKNLRLINGEPLIAYCIKAIKECSLVDEIYINSEADIFGSIAEDYGINFYKRPAELASNAANNDSFVIDFMNNVEGDILLQLLPTSPLITGEEIAAFIKSMRDGNFETMVSVVNHKIAALFEGKEINFSRIEPHISSQNMVPVQTYATVLMAWTYQTFKENMSEYGFAYHGCKTKIGYFPLAGLSTIDVDYEEDFTLAEVALTYQTMQKEKVPVYYGEQQ